jgi:hypothetical protein
MKFYYEELAHAVIEAEKSHDGSAICKLEDQQRQWCNHGKGWE